MTFDIHQNIFDADGMPFEKKAEEYKDELVELFEQSPERQALWEESFNGRWARIMLDLAQSHLGVTPPKMSEHDLREVLFDLIPMKISALATQAPEIIHDFQAFWQFLQREFHLENAAECLSVLGEEDIEQRVEEEMGNPDNFGMAKSFVMGGLERGFDMRTQEGIDEWMRTYNAELAAGKAAPFNLAGFRKQMGIGDPEALIHMLEASEEDYVDADVVEGPDEGLLGLAPHPGVPGRSARKTLTKQKAKMAKASRKKNRRRK